jgi:hypothetical protein
MHLGIRVLCCALIGPRHGSDSHLGPKMNHLGQGGFMIAAHDPRYRIGALLLFVLALIIPCAMVGCGGGGGDKPAPVDAAQAKKAQEYMSSYRDQIIAANKAKAQAKAQEKKSP